MLPLDIGKWLDILVSSDNDNKPWATSPAFPPYWLAGDVKEIAHFSHRVGT